MVHLILSSTKGNQGLRYFPHVGYLGLTPIRVEGIVRTKLDSDLKTLPAKSLTISVRCYESRVGRVNVLQSNILVDLTQVLWTKPDDVDYEQVGAMEYPFRITIPPKAAGFSTAVFVDYRCTWRVEAVLSHAPITGVGSRQIRHFELPLIRYDLPIYPHISDNQHIVLNQQTSKPRAPRIRYSLNPPAFPIGPLDLVSIPLHMQPVDQNVSIRSANVIIERRIQLHDLSTVIPMSSPQSSSSTSNSYTPLSPFPSSASSSSLSSQATTPSQTNYSSQQAPSSSASSLHPSDSASQPSQETAFTQNNPLLSTSSLSSSNPTITPDTVFPSTTTLAVSTFETTPLLPQSAPTTTPPTAAKIVVNTIVGTETENFSRDARGLWSKTLTLQWPASKTHSRWAIGETIFSDLVSVKYFVRVKITVASISGTDSIELSERELLVVSTNESERQLALAKYAELAENSNSAPDAVPRSKSKSPRRSKLEKDDLIPPSPAPYASSSSGSRNESHSHAQSSSGKSKPTARRPHTSAGPRDKSNIGGSASGGSKDPHRKRRSEVGWGAVTGGVGGDNGVGRLGSGTTQAHLNSNDINSLWRPDTGNSMSAFPSSVGRASSNLKQGRSSSSGKLSSSSFWSTATPFAPSSSPGVVNNTSSTSTTASSSSVSSSSHGSGKKRRDSGGEDGGASVNEERRQYYQQHLYQQHQQQFAQGSAPIPVPVPVPHANSHHHSHHHHHLHVREWEEELARIEAKSRKSSDLLGFARKRKKSVLTSGMSEPKMVMPEDDSSP